MIKKISIWDIDMGDIYYTHHMSYPRVLKHASTILFVWVMASMVWATWFHIFHTSLCLSLGILKKKKNYLRNILCSELNILLNISFLNSMKTYILLVIRSYFYFFFLSFEFRFRWGHEMWLSSCMSMVYNRSYNIFPREWKCC